MSSKDGCCSLCYSGVVYIGDTSKFIASPEQHKKSEVESKHHDSFNSSYLSLYSVQLLNLWNMEILIGITTTVQGHNTGRTHQSSLRSVMVSRNVFEVQWDWANLYFQAIYLQDLLEIYNVDNVLLSVFHRAGNMPQVRDLN